jgi:non-ribosomal peptide synthase protein (TIGR01720 family)
MPGGRNTEASASSITASLSEEDTETLLREAPAALGTEINALLLTALAGSFRQWTGNPALLINLEGHGREDSWADLDVTRTAGWFTTIFPVRLEAESADPLETLRAVNDQLRRILNRGIGYGLLRYLCDPENTRRFRALPQPEVSFNYLGQFGQEPAQASFLRPTGGPNGPMRSGRQRRAHLIDVTGGIAGGRLRLEWIYSRELHKVDSVRKIAEAFLIGLRDLAAAARSTDKCAGREEPAEPVSDLDAADLDVVLGGLA